MLGVSSPGRDVIEYHNGRHFIAILGGLVGQDRARRLTRIVVNDEPLTDVYGEGNRGRELSGLDAADISFLFSKGAFNLPPKAIW